MESEVYLITSNPNKAREIGQILGTELKTRAFELHEIQSLDVRVVAEDKARKAFDELGKPVIVEDTGLYIEAWRGFPGALVAWMVKSIDQARICSMVGDNRAAYAETCIAYYDGKRMHSFTGRAYGTIAQEPRGETGFGWDAIFVPEGHQRTFAELGPEEKNAISHRAKALMKLREHMKL
ncbi:MAG: RdgB/HAM1 family non-canonical purine NTP pyrophosphatase [Candidatus Micrarchaeota archaeon]|nr:RdgB/HAM1 family non-canonical purine NTP pyrophosphatase [Candidatus Micrarchaeota archaeon]